MRPLLDDIEDVAGDMPPLVDGSGAAGLDEPNSSRTDPPVQDSTPPQVTTDRAPFSFFRSYRFPPVSLDELATSSSGTPRSQSANAAASGAANAAGSASIASMGSQATSVPAPVSSGRNVQTDDVVMEGTAEEANLLSAESQPGQQSGSQLPAESAGESASAIQSGGAAATTPAATGQPASRTSNRQVVPMLLVGVRSASLQALTGSEGQTGMAARPHSPASRSHSTGGGSSTFAANAESSASAASASAQNGSNASRSRESSGFILWILGGLYPPNHPIVVAPSLLGDDTMSYDELLRLAEVLGTVKPPTVTSEEIKKSALKIVKAAAIPELQSRGQIRDITAERCLGELTIS